MFAARGGFFATQAEDPNIYLRYDTTGHPNNQVTIRLEDSGNVDVTVYWGDGTSNYYNSNGVKTKNYATAGNYLITITGNKLYYLNWFPTGHVVTGNPKLKEVISFGNLGLRGMGLANVSNLTSLPNVLPPTFDNAYRMFTNNTTLTNNAVSNIQYWNTSNVGNFYGVFRQFNNFNQPIGNWNVSKATNFFETFLNAHSFNSNIASWDTGNVITFSNMFRGANVFNQPIGNWNTGNATNMANMFRLTSFNQDISNWDTSKVTFMAGMFSLNPDFNQNIGNWNLSNVTSIEGMFEGANSFNQDLPWNTPKVTNMQATFSGAISFNSNISGWNTANVTNMTSMFNNATVFNQNISSWCVTNIVSEPTNFATGSALTANNKPVWGTCPP